MSAEVQAELDAATARRDEAHRIRTEVDEQMKPVRDALRVNGFETAVLATFQRRNTP